MLQRICCHLLNVGVLVEDTFDDIMISLDEEVGVKKVLSCQSSPLCPADVQCRWELKHQQHKSQTVSSCSLHCLSGGLCGADSVRVQHRKLAA